MATAGDGKAPYESGGAGGKFRKRPFRRNVPAKPYDRPPIPLRSNNPSLLTKLVDPASRLIYAGAHRLFGAFRKRLPSLSLQGPPEVNVEPQNVLQEPGQIENSCNISAATGILELEQMLQQKSFTSSETQRLTALLHSRTTESPSDVVQRDEAKPYYSPSSFLRIEASTSGSLKKHENERDNRFSSFSTPIVSSKVFKEDVASPAELAKAYMGYMPIPTKVSPSPLRQDYKSINNTMGPPKTPITSMGPKTADSFRGQENGFVTPRSRGRSAMYNMARTPYARSPSTFTQKLIGSSYGHDATLTSSQSGFGHDEKTALKRRSSVLDDDIGSGGPLCRTRQKANLLSQRERRETANQKLLLTNGPEPNVFKRAEENGETSIDGSGSGYASIPTKSTQTATKILQHLEKLGPKEKEINKLTSLEKVDSPKLLNYPRDIQKQEVISKGKEKIEENGFEKFPSPRNMLTSVNGEPSVTIRDNPPIVKITDPPLKVQGEPPQKKRAFQMSVADDSFEIDDDEIYVNGNVSFPLVENNKPETTLLTNKPVADIIKIPKVPEVSRTPALVENDKPVFPEAVKSPEQPPELKEAENSKSFVKTDGGSVSDQGLGFKLPNLSSPTITIQTNVIPQTENFDLKRDRVGKFGENVSPFSFSANEIKPNSGTDPKAVESASVFTKNDSVSNKNENGKDQKTTNIFGKPDHAKDSVINKNENGNDLKSTNVFGKSPAATSASGSFMFGAPSNNSTTSNVTPVTTAPTFPSFTSFPASTAATTTTTAASSIFSTSVQPPPVFSFGSANTTSALTTTSVTENGKTDATNKQEPKSTITTSPFAITSFATTTTTAATTTTTGSSLFGFSSPAATSTTIAATGTGSSLSGFSFPAATSTTTAAAATGSSVFGFSSPAATSTTTAATGSSVFGFSSPAATSTTTAAAATGSSPFGFSSPAATSTTAAATGSSPFGFSSPAAMSTTTAATGSSPFGFSSRATTSTTTAATGSSPFGFSSPAATSTTIAATGSSLFGLSSPATTTQTAPFQLGSTEGKSGTFTSGPTTSVFGSTWQAPQSSGFGSTFSSTPSSVFSFGASSTPTPSATASPAIFSSTGASTGFFATAGATNSTFATPSQSQPIFGKSTPVFGAISPNNNNDRMSMEDGMAEDSMQTPGPVSPFGQTQTPVAAPGFMFGSANPTQTQPPVGFQFGGQPSQPAVGFQFGGQPSQPPPQNPFQSSSVEFNGGGSFSLGSGGDKSGRRFVKVKKQTRRK